jgi:hypothetical protein
MSTFHSPVSTQRESYVRKVGVVHQHAVYETGRAYARADNLLYITHTYEHC